MSPSVGSRPSAVQSPWQSQPRRRHSTEPHGPKGIQPQIRRRGEQAQTWEGAAI